MSIEALERHPAARPRMMWCAAAPAAALALITIVMLVFGAAGRHPLWPHDTLSLSEAAALRDAAEVVRQLGAGADPNARFPVRAGVLDATPSVLTPLDAAVEAGRGEVVALLLARGAAPDADDWTRLSCRARERRAPDVELELSRWRDGARAACGD